jgi:hypothetical protein
MRGSTIVATLSEEPLIVLTGSLSVVLELFFDQVVVLHVPAVEKRARATFESRMVQ